MQSTYLGSSDIARYSGERVTGISGKILSKAVSAAPIADFFFLKRKWLKLTFVLIPFRLISCMEFDA